MERDPQAAVKILAHFLSQQLSQKIVLKIVEQTNFDSMKQNHTANSEWMKEYHTD